MAHFIKAPSHFLNEKLPCPDIFYFKILQCFSLTQNILGVTYNLSFTANVPYLQFYVDLYDYLISAILPH